METINININRKICEYDIFIGNDILSEIYDYIGKYTNATKILVVTNPTVKNLYGKYFEKENTHFAVIEDGEIYKNIKSYEDILNKACEVGLERKDVIVALGGGVIGDLAGFAASTYLRGVDFIQVPTTLLAMVDSSVGGKTGFNNSYGKNLIGAFYQPKFVFADISTLKTLDEIQLSSGYGEILKYAFIEKNCKSSEELNLASFLFENTQNVLNFEEDFIIKMIKLCCELKVAVVQSDEKESGLRRILNFGHTIGHSIEKALDFKGISHGQAVVLGMKIIFNYAVSMGLIDNNYRIKAFSLMDKLAPVENLPQIDIEKVQKGMLYDKKIENGKINFIVPSSFASVQIIENIDKPLLNDEIVKFFTK